MIVAYEYLFKSLAKEVKTCWHLVLEEYIFFNSNVLDFVYRIICKTLVIQISQPDIDVVFYLLRGVLQIPFRLIGTNMIQMLAYVQAYEL